MLFLLLYVIRAGWFHYSDYILSQSEWLWSNIAYIHNNESIYK